MLELNSQQNKKLEKILKTSLKNNEVLDIFRVGSSLKNKMNPSDLDVFVLFKNKNTENISEILFEIKENLNDFKKVHIEPLYSEDFFGSPLFLSVLREGYSVGAGKSVSDIFGLNNYAVFSFGLENLSKGDKVRFSQALYGRKKDGIFYLEKAVSLGPGSFMVSVLKEEIFKEIFKKWGVKYKARTALVY